MANINDCLIKIQNLTKQNLEILQAINDSFMSKKDHLSVNVNGQSFIMPSFISLENKINILQENFENLINAPETSEAYFNMDGNSRSIEVRKYNHAPDKLSLNPVTNFGVESNKVFRDIVSPKPYINCDLKSIPNDITKINVKKIVAKSQEAKDIFKKHLTGSSTGTQVSSQISYADLYKEIVFLGDGIDEYDTLMTLPIHKHIGVGNFKITKIIADSINDNLIEEITVKLDTTNYKLFDETISAQLNSGDELVNHDSTVKFKIKSVQYNTLTVILEVVNGEYSNLYEGDILKFFSSTDFDNDKYIHIPLEEDQYIFIAIAPVNDRMNIQASWGDGILVNTYALIKEGSSDLKFKKYYDEYVNNIGDILNELIISGPGALSGLSNEEYENKKSFKPSTDHIKVTVDRINSHLQNNNIISNIKSLYNQKKIYQAELANINSQINDINNQLLNISFTDTSNMRASYLSQLSSLGQDKTNIVAAITNIINEISTAAQSTELPIENSKYHVRGYIDIDDVFGFRIEYKYINTDNENSKTLNVGGKDFPIWNIQETNLNLSTIQKSSNGNYNSVTNNLKDINNINNIDIPITQGEKVVIRYKIIYKYGYPYSQMTSDYSDEYTVGFPEDFVKDIEISDIISENNSDAETYKLNNLLSEKGISEHIDNKIVDQDITYFHQPENIASGYYTAERRIIPLKDKLEDLTNKVTQLLDEINGTTSDSVSVSIGIGNNINNINTLQDNSIYVEAYSNLISSDSQSVGAKKTEINGAYVIDSDNIVSVNTNIILTNNSTHTTKLYPLFPGNKDQTLNTLTRQKYDVSDFIGGGISDESKVYVITSASPAPVSSPASIVESPAIVSGLIGAIVKKDNDGYFIEYINNEKINRIDIIDNSLFIPSGSGIINDTSANAIINVQYKNIKERWDTNIDPLNIRNFFSATSPNKVKVLVAQYSDNNYYGVNYSAGAAQYSLLTFDTDKYKIGESTIYCQNDLIKILLIGNTSYNNLQSGVYMQYRSDSGYKWKLQSQNQFINFRVRDAYNGEPFYTNNAQSDEYNQLYYDNIKISSYIKSVLYPQVQYKYALDAGSNDSISFLTINPGESVVIPLIFKYKLDQKDIVTSKTISFDLRPSLYKDPITYKFNIIAKYSQSVQDKLAAINQQYNTNTKYNTTIIK